MCRDITSRSFMMFPDTELRLICWFPGTSFLPILKTRAMFPFFESPGITPDCHDFSNMKENVLAITPANSLFSWRSLYIREEENWRDFLLKCPLDKRCSILELTFSTAEIDSMNPSLFVWVCLSGSWNVAEYNFRCLSRRNRQLSWLWADMLVHSANKRKGELNSWTPCLFGFIVN